MHTKLSIPTMDRPFTEDEAHFLQYQVDYFLTWLRDAVHWLATLQTLTLTQNKNIEQIRMYELLPSYDELSFRWLIYYGRVYINLHADDPLYFEPFTSKEWHKYKVFDQRRPRLKEQFLAHYTACLDSLICGFLPKIKQENGFRICSMPVHSLLSFDKTPHVFDEPFLTICERISQRWFCENCLKSYGLGEWSYPPLPAKGKARFKQEWDKLLRPTRRLEILERDNFTCQQCHCSPMQHPLVKLAVTHIISVTEGGKTKPDNLQVLYRDCIGKTQSTSPTSL